MGVIWAQQWRILGVVVSTGSGCRVTGLFWPAKARREGRRPVQADMPGRNACGINLGPEPRLAPMPSYRLELEIGDLRPGTAPQQVMEAALASLLVEHVDATDIQVVDGTARILVRFTVPASSDAEEGEAAQAAARHAREAVEHIASTGRSRLLRRHRGSWLTNAWLRE